MVNRKTKIGFTLIEVLVSLFLFSIILILLFRGVTAVITTVTLGQRQSSIYRNLKVVKRVMDQDVASMIVHRDWPVFIGDSTSAGSDQLLLAFLRYDRGGGENTNTEWVQYWREPHPTVDRLAQWVRYSGPADNRADHKGEWWSAIDKDDLTREILADELIEIELRALTREGAVLGVVTHQIESVDLGLSLTVPPQPELLAIDTGTLRRMRQEDGGWLHFRLKPGFSMGPTFEVIP